MDFKAGIIRVLAVCIYVASSGLQSVKGNGRVLSPDLTPHSSQIMSNPIEDLTRLMLIRIAIEPKKIVRTLHPQPLVNIPHRPVINRPMLAQHAAPYHGQDLESRSRGPRLRLAIHRRSKERDGLHAARVDGEGARAIVRHHEIERLSGVGVQDTGDLADEVPGVASVNVASGIDFERLVGLDPGCQGGGDVALAPHGNVDGQSWGLGGRALRQVRGSRLDSGFRGKGQTYDLSC